MIRNIDICKGCEKFSIVDEEFYSCSLDYYTGHTTEGNYVAREIDRQCPERNHNSDLSNMELLSEQDRLVFEKRNEDDNVTQFWCEDIKCSIFIDKIMGIIAASPEEMGIVIRPKENVELDKE